MLWARVVLISDSAYPILDEFVTKFSQYQCIKIDSLTTVGTGIGVAVSRQLTGNKVISCHLLSQLSSNPPFHSSTFSHRMDADAKTFILAYLHTCILA